MLKDILKKKFKVKVQQLGIYHKDRYEVFYAHYHVFPNWKPLMWWFDCGPDSPDLASWSTQIYYIKEAEQVAKTINCIEDVRKFHAPEHVKRKAYWESVKEYEKKNAPYYSKEF